MCRLVAYLGEPLLLKTVLVDPVNSLLRQSLRARESQVPTNGDGFGVGWYNLEVDPEPALFTSISPAWNDRNLLQLTSKIKSSCFFGHVRAAGTGGVSMFNCHPFAHGRWMLMHNGDIGDFLPVKRHLRRLLDDDIYNWIQGATDSEHLFALFLQLAKGRDLASIEVVGDVLHETFLTILDLVRTFGDGSASWLNVCLTDGERMVATRYCSDKRRKPESLHYFEGLRKTPVSALQNTVLRDWRCVLLASEKLNDINSEWVDIPPAHMLLVDRDLQQTMRAL